MEFILDDKVGRLERSDVIDPRGWPPATLVGDVAAGVVLAGGDVPVAVAAAALNSAEQRLNATVPRHLGELVDRRDDQRWRMSVDLVIDRVGRDPVQPPRVRGSEIAIVVGAEDLDTLLVIVRFVLLGTELRSAPRATEKLGRRSTLGALFFRANSAAPP